MVIRSEDHRRCVVIGVLCGADQVGEPVGALHLGPRDRRDHQPQRPLADHAPCGIGERGARPVRVVVGAEGGLLLGHLDAAGDRRRAIGEAHVAERRGCLGDRPLDVAGDTLGTAEEETAIGAHRQLTSQTINGGSVDVADRGRPADHVGCDLEGVVHRRRRREAETSHGPCVTADDDHPPAVLHPVGAPIPHVEGVDAVIGVARAVEVPVPLVGGVLLLPLLRHLVRIGGVGENLLEEVDVARMVDRVEVPRRRVGHDHHASLAHERLAPVQVEEVPQPGAHHEDRVHDRVHVVGADVGDPHREDVGLPADLDELLLVDVLCGDLVHRLDLTGVDAGHLVRRLDRVEDLPRQPGGRAGERLGSGQVGGAIACRPFPFPLGEEVERRGEGVGVDRRLDLEDRRTVSAHHLAHPPVALVQLAAVLVHERVARLHRLRVVVVAEGPVRGEAGGSRFPAAIHRHHVDVDVDEQVALGGRAC